MEYELTVVLPEKTTPAKKKSVTETIEKMVTLFKGKIKKSNDWGKVELAYPIKKNMAGVFLNFLLELEPDKVKTLEQKIKLEENVVRYLLVRKEKGK